MNLSLFTSATGMEAQQKQLNTISNNLANANTTGFKRAKIEFQDMLYQQSKSAGATSGDGNVLPTQVEMGNGTQVVSTSRVFTQGNLSQTGGELDLAVDGQGFLEVELPNGETGYTRDGSLKIASDGRVVTSAGYPVLSNFQSIPDGAESITVTTTGDVTVQTASGATSFRLQLARFNNPAGLQSLGGNVYVESDASGTAETGNPAQNGFGGIIQGFLEGSNVNVVEEMVNMITAQRAYEINSKSIQASDEMLQTAAQLRR